MNTNAQPNTRPPFRPSPRPVPGTATATKTRDDARAPLVFHIVNTRRLREQGNARALCGELIRRDGSTQTPSEDGGGWTLCALCDLARMDIIRTLEGIGK
ncbi:hypothetical protein [Bifidobacterium panos]|uniref:Uncharacterized protein n=1 Tax=Bifidobacterium panos TaxID=2675321 RepID=A0ABX1SX05_9BIFI|nr:hypothetical protein [Bifidobacterium sp. DSM 109963]NMN02361.1 hypothetical protein [Bifidobacterium sp. DSM 109963]